MIVSRALCFSILSTFEVFGNYSRKELYEGQSFRAQLTNIRKLLTTEIMSNTQANNAELHATDHAPEEKRATLGIRHLHIGLLCSCIAVSLIMRVNLSLAIVAMIDKESANPEFEDFAWNEQTQSLVLSSFFWGYILTQIPAGQMAEKKGAKYVLLVSTVVSAVIAIITPICTSLGGWQAMCALRVISGLSQGVVFPSVHTVLSKWIPASELGPLGTYCYVGAELGTVVMLALSGVLASSSMGWPSIFYFSGVVSLVWAVIWWWLGSSKPEDNRWILDSEKDFILASKTKENHNGKDPIKLSTPWLSIITSAPFWALTLSQAAQMWGLWTLMTKSPAHMKHILKFELEQNALFSALPHLAKVVLSFGFGALAQFLHQRQLFSLNFSRKFFNSIGQWIPAVLLIGFSYVSYEHAEVAVALLTIAIGINAAPYLGYQVNHIDLAPNFSGTLMGISNGVANIFSLVAPLIIGFIVTDETNPDQWRIIFFIAAGVYFIGNLMFVIFGEVTVQPWNDYQSKASTEEIPSTFDQNETAQKK